MFWVSYDSIFYILNDYSRHLCRGPNQIQSCHRTDKVFGLMVTEGTSFTNGTDAYWKEYPEFALTKPKSSHVLLTVPRTFAPKCRNQDWFHAINPHYVLLIKRPQKEFMNFNVSASLA